MVIQNKKKLLLAKELIEEASLNKKDLFKVISNMMSTETMRIKPQLSAKSSAEKRRGRKQKTISTTTLNKNDKQRKKVNKLSNFGKSTLDVNNFNTIIKNKKLGEKETR